MGAIMALINADFASLNLYRDANLHAKLAEREVFCNYHRPHGDLRGKTLYERLIEKMR